MDKFRDLCTHELDAAEKDRLLAKIEAVLSSRGEIMFAYAHGSFLGKGPFRDLDIAVYLEAGVHRGSFLYEDGLAQVLGRAIDGGFPLDVRIINGAPITFRYRACTGRLLVDRDPDFRAEFIAHVAMRFLDLKPVLDHYFQEAFGDGPRS